MCRPLCLPPKPSILQGSSRRRRMVQRRRNSPKGREVPSAQEVNNSKALGSPRNLEGSLCPSLSETSCMVYPHSVLRSGSEKHCRRHWHTPVIIAPPGYWDSETSPAAQQDTLSQRNNHKPHDTALLLGSQSPVTDFHPQK